MADQRIRIDGWLIAETATVAQWNAWDQRGHLFLFRGDREWTLLTLNRSTQLDEFGYPTGGRASVYAESFLDLPSLRAELARAGLSSTWRELVKAGAENADRALLDLWTPVRLERSLARCSVRVAGLAADAGGRKEHGWAVAAVSAAVDRLRERGFVVLKTDNEYQRLLGDAVEVWAGTQLIGAAIVARYGLKTRVGIAVDQWGEVYIRMPESGFEPGDSLEWPPEPLSDADWGVVKQADGERRAQARRRREQERRNG